MERLSQEYILRLAFSSSIDREELMLKKYDEYYTAFKDSTLKEIVKEFKETSREHIDLLKDKMLKLNYQEQGR